MISFPRLFLILSLQLLSMSSVPSALARGVLFTASDSGRGRAWAVPGCFNRVPTLAACGGTLVTSHSRDHHADSFSNELGREDLVVGPARSPRSPAA
jgi:hypothetical protein